MPKEELEDILIKAPYLQESLFKRGYIVTSENLNVEIGYPFYGNWKKVKINKVYYLYVHKDQKYYINNSNRGTDLLIGHAYNPWDNIAEEDKILKTLSTSLEDSKDAFFEELKKITGVFAAIKIDGEEIIAVQDSVGIMPIYYSETGIYISSHSQLIADLCDFSMDENIKNLINSKFYLIGIRHLPGIKSSFKEIKALTSNTYYTSSNNKCVRFYPDDKFNILDENTSLEVISKVLLNSMNLIATKYNASISLTGGTDSKMTLAATNGLYQKFDYFSFFSTEAEKKDAIAAGNICKSLGLKHEIFEIPSSNDDIDDFYFIKKIIEHNSAYMKKYKDEELRKITYLSKQNSIDFEVKSHVSEIGRAFYYKKLGVKVMPNPLKPRHMSNLYKRNMFDRNILKYMDDAFEEFINVTDFGLNFFPRYDQSDMFYWEHRMSQWAAITKLDFNISHETTIIYNNRKLLDTFMNFTLKDRIEDIPQQKIIRKLNPELFNLNISNDNAMKNKLRIFLGKVFFEINSKVP